MRRTLLIARREFLENVKTKGFWMGVLLFPVLIMLSALLPGLLAGRATPTRPFIIIDASGKYASTVVAAVQAEEARLLDRSALGRTNGPSRSQRYRLIPTPPELPVGGDLVALEAALRPRLNDRGTNGLFAAVIFPAGFGPNSTNALRFWCANQADTSLRDLVERSLRAEFRRGEYARLGLDGALIQRIETLRVPITVLSPVKAAGREKVGLADQITQWAPSGFVYLLWVAIFTVSQMLLNSVIEEKSNRLIEVLLSSVTSTQFMMGKLMGIAAVGMVILGSWLGSLSAVALWQSGAAAATAAAGSGAGELPKAVMQVLQGTWLVPAFIFYFFCGYILYATVFLTIGSLCNTIKEAQNFMGPMMLILMVPLFLMPFIPRDPNGPLATALSWIPPYTPFVMMNRVAAHPPLWQVVGTSVLLMGFIAGLLWACGLIFRRAILRTGQPPKFLELLRWVGARREG